MSRRREGALVAALATGLALVLASVFWLPAEAEVHLTVLPPEPAPVGAAAAQSAPSPAQPSPAAPTRAVPTDPVPEMEDPTSEQWRAALVADLTRTAALCGADSEVLCRGHVCVVPTQWDQARHLRAHLRRPMRGVESFAVRVLGLPEDYDQCDAAQLALLEERVWVPVTGPTEDSACQGFGRAHDALDPEELDRQIRAACAAALAP